MNKALILDGHLKSALTAVRALGRSGVTVLVAAERSTAMALHSRYVSDYFLYPSPKANPGEFLSFIIKQATEYKNDTGLPLVVYAFSDATNTLLFENYNELKDLILMLLPAPGSFSRAANKKETLELAESLGVPIIPLLSFSERHEHQYPLVIKPRRSIIWRDGVVAAGTAEFVFNPEELHKRYDDIENKNGESPLIQPLIKGAEYGIEMLCADGEILRTFAHKRIRSLSPNGGAAVVKETLLSSPLKEELEHHATRLVKSLNWSGPIMVEFKYDDVVKTPRLMEINGRFWGSLPLAQKAGVDFVGAYYEWLVGGTLPPATPAAAKKLRTRHFLGDVKWLLAVWFKKDKMRPILYPARLKATTVFLLEIFRSRGDIFSVWDPLPSLYEILDVIKR